jgi:hypothetical protein
MLVSCTFHLAFRIFSLLRLLARVLLLQGCLDPTLSLLPSTTPLWPFDRYWIGHATFSFGCIFGPLLFPLLISFSECAHGTFEESAICGVKSIQLPRFDLREGMLDGGKRGMDLK